MYYRIPKIEKFLFLGKKIAQVWAVTLNISSHLEMTCCFKQAFLILVITFFETKSDKNVAILDWQDPKVSVKGLTTYRIE